LFHESVCDGITELFIMGHSNSRSSKYLGIILCSNVSWVDQVNYTVKKSLQGTSFYNAYS
jgi:hypothetical protein